MYTIHTDKLKAHGITEQTEFTPEQFAPYQAQYDAIMAQEELESQVILPEPDPVAVYTNAVQMHLDSEARKKNYDGILSAVSYVGDPDPKFNAEGLAYRAWRGAVWKKCYTILDEVRLGRPAPTIAEVIAELPVLVLPE